MHQDWTTVRGKKLNNPKNQIFSYKELRSIEPIILVNIDNIITEEFKKIVNFSQGRYPLNTPTPTPTPTTITTTTTTPATTTTTTTTPATSLTYQWGDV